MKRVIVAGALLTMGSFATSVALAQEGDNVSGFYLGAGIGRFDFNDDVDDLDQIDDDLEGFGLDDDDNAWKIFAGYRLNQYLSLELDYIDFGRVRDDFEANGSDGEYSVDFSGIAPYVVGTLPVGPVELSAKAGYLFYDVKVDVDFDDGDLDSKSNEEDWIWGLGVGATLFQHLALKVEYEEVNVPHGADASAYWLTGAWRF